VSSPQSKASPSIASLMVWNYKTAPIDDPTHADPNFLDRRSLCHSPWHSCLHAWKSLHGFRSSEACPRLFHVDIHGKNDRKADMDIDVGLQALQEAGCLTEEAVQTLRTKLVAELRIAFKGRIAVSSKVKKPFPITIEADPILDGYWGRDTVMTISHQAALLGITAVQLEIPLAIRRLLMKDEALMDAFASAISACSLLSASLHSPSNFAADLFASSPSASSNAMYALSFSSIVAWRTRSPQASRLFDAASYSAPMASAQPSALRTAVFVSATSPISARVHDPLATPAPTDCTADPTPATLRS
jgi:hypothetical protein